MGFHKLLAVLFVVFWAIYHFQARKDEDLRYSDGKPIRTGDTKNFHNDGAWKWYHQNGKIQIEGNFQEGKRVGIWKTYDAEGHLILESTYKNNLLNGLFIQYDSTGTVLRKEIYRDDILINQLVP
jgi:antitoxin component YwqK of YwqJK toxin-antitoxin module